MSVGLPRRRRAAHRSLSLRRIGSSRPGWGSGGRVRVSPSMRAGGGAHQRTDCPVSAYPGVRCPSADLKVSAPWLFGLVPHRPPVRLLGHLYHGALLKTVGFTVGVSYGQCPPTAAIDVVDRAYRTAGEGIAAQV